MKKKSKSVSKSQQKLMGMAYAYNKGELSNASPEVIELAKAIKKKDLKDFAKTKHKNLPEHKKSKIIYFFTKLANFLDKKNLIEMADLADKIAIDLLQGGKADNISNDNFDLNEISLGLPEEIEEHTDNPKIGLEIVKDHLIEDPNYYSKMKS